MQLVKIKNINVSHKSKKFIVKGRIKPFPFMAPLRGGGTRLLAVLFDKTSCIQLVAFNSDCDIIMEKIQTYSILSISNVIVDDNTKFQMTNHKYQLILSSNTMVTHILDNLECIEDFPHECPFVKGYQLARLRPGSFVDVVGKLINVSELIKHETYFARKKFGTLLVDSFEIRLVFFREKADDIYEVGSVLQLYNAQYEFKNVDVLNIKNFTTVVKPIKDEVQEVLWDLENHILLNIKQEDDPPSPVIKEEKLDPEFLDSVSNQKPSTSSVLTSTSNVSTSNGSTSSALKYFLSLKKLSNTLTSSSSPSNTTTSSASTSSASTAGVFTSTDPELLAKVSNKKPSTLTDSTSRALTLNSSTSNALNSNASTSSDSTSKASTSSASKSSASTSNGLTSSASTSNGLTSSASTSNGLTSSASTSNGLTSSASTSNGLTSSASTSNGLTSSASISSTLTSNALTSSASTSNGLTSSASTSSASTSSDSTSSASTSNGLTSSASTSSASTSNGLTSSASTSSSLTSEAFTSSDPGTNQTLDHCIPSTSNSSTPSVVNSDILPLKRKISQSNDSNDDKETASKKLITSGPEVISPLVNTLFSCMLKVIDDFKYPDNENLKLSIIKLIQKEKEKYN